jgi:hypothetical protein
MVRMAPTMSVPSLLREQGVDPTPLVSAALPSAFVRRLDRRAGFAETANGRNYPAEPQGGLFERIRHAFRS